MSRGTDIQEYMENQRHQDWWCPCCDTLMEYVGANHFQCPHCTAGINPTACSEEDGWFHFFHNATETVSHRVVDGECVIQTY